MRTRTDFDLKDSQEFSDSLGSIMGILIQRADKSQTFEECAFDHLVTSDQMTVILLHGVGGKLPKLNHRQQGYGNPQFPYWVKWDRHQSHRIWRVQGCLHNSRDQRVVLGVTCEGLPF